MLSGIQLEGSREEVMLSPDGLLYDQTDNLAGFCTPSQYFPNLDAYGVGADDFMVPSPGWIITRVVGIGVYSNNPAPNWDVNIYDDSSGSPGTLIYSDTAVVAFSDANNYVTIDLTTPASLDAGTYWVSVVANLSLTDGGQYFWCERSVQSYEPYHWTQDGLFSGVGCIGFWGTGAACFGEADPDLLFALYGTVVPWVTNMSFDKTVGLDPDVCATTDEITVPAGMGGTDVTYCYSLENTGNVTLTYHMVDDDQLGTFTSTLSIGPGETGSFTETAAITETTVNVATWYVSDDGVVVISDTDTATVTQQPPTSVALSSIEFETTNWLIPVAFVAMLSIAGAAFVLRRKATA